MIVLDASAVLAVAHKESGAAKVLAKRTELMVISSVNYAEALQKVVQHGGMAEDAVRILPPSECRHRRLHAARGMGSC